MSLHKYKALITDVDGTLVTRDRNALPSKKVIEAVKKASKLIHVGLATSRPLYMLTDIFKLLSLSGPSVINGGAQVVDVKTQKILWKKNIPDKDFYQAVKIIQKYNLPFFVQEGQSEDVVYNSEYVPNERVLLLAIVELREEIGRELRRELKVIPSLGIHITPDWRAGKVAIVITHAQATKQYGVFEIAKILGIDTKEIIGVGDGLNDFPLLMASGLKVAMGDAPEDLKAIADLVVPTAEKDGLVEVINKYIL